MNIIDELSWRGAVNQMTDEAGLRKLTQEKSVSLYCGVDPAAVRVLSVIPADGKRKDSYKRLNKSVKMRKN